MKITLEKIIKTTLMPFVTFGMGFHASFSYLIPNKYFKKEFGDTKQNANKELNDAMNKNHKKSFMAGKIAGYATQAVIVYSLFMNSPLKPPVYEKQQTTNQSLF